MYSRHMGHGTECACGGHSGCHGGPCACGGHMGYGMSRAGQRRFRRRFMTRDERIARLERYLEALEAEAQAVREMIAGLRGSQPQAEEPQGESGD